MSAARLTTFRGAPCSHRAQWQTIISMSTDHMKSLHDNSYKSPIIRSILIGN